MKSISQQLLIGLSAGILSCSLVAGVMSYLNVHEEAGELLDLQLQQLSAALPTNFLQQPVQATDDDADDDLIIQAWDGNHSPLYSSTQEIVLPRFPGDGFDTVSAMGERWRIFREFRHGRFVQVAQPTEVRQEIAAELALQSTAPFLFLIPAFALLIGIVVYRSLRPLRWLANSVSERSHDALHPLPSENLPPEMRPIILSLNDLLKRLDVALGAQRAFVADAAHELRSPLTALKLQLQLAERAQTTIERSAAFARLHQRLDRSTRLVQQLLTMARQQQDMAEKRIVAVDLCKLAREVVSEQAMLAEAREIDLGYAGGDRRLTIQGRPDDLRIMLNNLVDNAIRYTPHGGRIDVSVMIDQRRPALQVSDTGPGIPTSDRDRVFNRFYRREGADSTGSGLGLAIVKSIVENHGAAIRLEGHADGSGLMVTVTFADTAPG